MSELSEWDRFEELEAGRILGDLDDLELRKWKELSKSLEGSPDLSMELAAAAVETDFLQEKEEALPDFLQQRLLKEVLAQSPAVAQSKAGPKAGSGQTGNAEIIIRPALWQRVLGAKETAWAIAAALAILFAVTQFSKQPNKVNPEVAKQQLEGSASDLLKLDFAGLGDYKTLSGEVVWSDEKQEGYMVFSNLPANDPTANQYQLWIVDPTRDEKPVDGGVFDIPAGQSTAIIPIRNPLVVTNPQAFVITLEQPGGVVVSKQEVVVALAKPS